MSEETYQAPVTQLTDGPMHHFFGYYDKCPWDRSGRYLLAMENAFADHNPTINDAVTIGLGDRHVPATSNSHR